MRRNPYADLCLTAQALRREFEAVQTPLAPATGIAGSLYNHQIANVFRVLTDVRIRHLLADEVGLGKTVQALMILNALRYHRPDLRVLVVVPNDLVTQWRDEILTRAHSAPFENEEECEEEQYIRLAWEAQLSRGQEDERSDWSLSDIDPAKYQMLVVDELHSLRADVQDRIVRVAGAFEHVLALTATPAFQNVKRHAQLFALLEPERSAIIRRSAARPETNDSEDGMEDFSRWTEQAAKTVVDGMLKRDELAKSSCPDGDMVPIALAHCAYRRVIRTRRADYGNLLPRRQHVHHLIEPLETEVERQSLMWRYFGHLDTIHRRVDPVALAKRALLSPPSIRERIGELIRDGFDREGLLERVRSLSDRSCGDSRADALVDLLAEIWTRDPGERVLVAAQDNPTVDYLYDLVRTRLPVIGPLHRRTPLIAAKIRQMREAVDDLGGFGHETVENLEAFQRGTAQILFAHEAAREGHNLQGARVLVLYSVPWRPQEVEQWIGRLDRIGNTAAFTTDGEARVIDLHTIAQKGLVDENVVSVLQRFGLFERGINLDVDHLDKTAQRIEDAALRPIRTSWAGLENETDTISEANAFLELASDLRPHLPWTADYAAVLRKHLESLPPGPPALVSSRRTKTGPHSWDIANEGAMKLMNRAKEYYFRKNEDPNAGQFWTMWYRYQEVGEFGRKNIASKVKFSIDANPEGDRHPKHAHAYFCRRADLGNPPHRSVTLTIEGNEHVRPLHFLSFGNVLHNELVRGWKPESRPDEKARVLKANVLLPDDLRFFKNGDPSIFVLRFSLLDPASALDIDEFERETQKDLERSACALPTDRKKIFIDSLRRQVRCAGEADVRWLRGQLTANLRIEGMSRGAERWERATDDTIHALLNPAAHDGNTLPQSPEWHPEKQLISDAAKALNVLRSADKDAASSCWSHRFPQFEKALETRCHVVCEEGRDADSFAQLELAKADAALLIAQNRDERRQVTRTANLQKEAAIAVEAARIVWRHRLIWLEKCGKSVSSVRPRERLMALLRVQTAR